LPLLLIFPANRFVTAPRLVCVLIVKEQSSLESHRAIVPLPNYFGGHGSFGLFVRRGAGVFRTIENMDCFNRAMLGL